MPLYEYQCDACGRRFEHIQKFSDPLVETCPTCGGKVHKLVSSPAFHLKGTGWYATDYSRKDKGGAEGEKASGASSKDDKGSADKGSADKGSADKDSKPSSSAPDTTSTPNTANPTTTPNSHTPSKS